jgi:phospholipid/cholesterol/gamma-HCH transport system permease protein
MISRSNLLLLLLLLEIMFLYHLGRYVLLLKSAFTKPEKFDVYWKETFREMNVMGVGSLGIVSIIAVFLGAVTCVQTAYQLVSNLIPREVIGQITRDSTILEFSPSITMLVLSGRIGSNIASQIGTMRVTEQIDALEIMGVNTTVFLIMPKLIAGLFIIPMLIVFSMFLSLIGGYVAGTLSGVITPQEYVGGILLDWNPTILIVALIKTYVFVFLMITVSVYHGYYTVGGALEVGRSSTKAVVYSCILILCCDYLVAQLFL